MRARAAYRPLTAAAVISPPPPRSPEVYFPVFKLFPTLRCFPKLRGARCGAGQGRTPCPVRAAACAGVWVVGTHLRWAGSVLVPLRCRLTGGCSSWESPPPPFQRVSADPWESRQAVSGAQEPMTGAGAEAEPPGQEQEWGSCWWEANVRRRREAGSRLQRHLGWLKHIFLRLLL